MIRPPRKPAPALDAVLNSLVLALMLSLSACNAWDDDLNVVPAYEGSYLLLSDSLADAKGGGGTLVWADSTSLRVELSGVRDFTLQGRTRWLALTGAAALYRWPQDAANPEVARELPGQPATLAREEGVLAMAGSLPDSSGYWIGFYDDSREDFHWREIGDPPQKLLQREGRFYLLGADSLSVWDAEAAGRMITHAHGLNLDAGVEAAFGTGPGLSVYGAASAGRRPSRRRFNDQTLLLGGLDSVAFRQRQVSPFRRRDFPRTATGRITQGLDGTLTLDAEPAPATEPELAVTDFAWDALTHRAILLSDTAARHLDLLSGQATSLGTPPASRLRRAFHLH